MALIKCPECGKENVSDSAPTCPECGFAIREHFEKIEKARLATEQEVQRKKQAELQKQREIDNKKQREQRRLNSVPKPEKPKFGIGYAICGAIPLLIGAISIFTSDEYDVQRSISHGNGDPIFQGVYLIIFGLVILGVGVYQYSKKLSKYNLALSNFDEYKKQVLKEEDIEILNTQSRLKKLENAPKCPSCKSANVKHISTASRAVSVGMVGLASSKIGKTMECKNCGYKW